MITLLIFAVYFIVTLFDLFYAARSYEHDKLIHLDKPTKTFFEYFLNNNVWTLAAILLAIVVHMMTKDVL